MTTSSTSTSTVTTTETTTTDGLLISTSGDLNASVGGSATYSFGDGYTTETLKGDSVHTVDAGKYTLNTSGDIDMTAEGDIELSAYNMNIEVAGGNTITINGGSVEIVKSPAKTNRMSTSQDIMWGDTTLIKFSASFSMSMSISLSLSGAAKNSISIGTDVSVQLGASIKAVAGYNTAFVLGMDYKKVNGKIVQNGGNSLKILSLFEYKKTKYDFKLVDYEFKSDTKSLDDIKTFYKNGIDKAKFANMITLRRMVEADNLDAYPVIAGYVAIT